MTRGWIWISIDLRTMNGQKHLPAWSLPLNDYRGTNREAPALGSIERQAPLGNSLFGHTASQPKGIVAGTPRDLLEQFALGDRVGGVSVRAYSSAQVTQHTTRVVRMISDSCLVHAHIIERHTQCGWEDVRIGLRRIDAMRGNFAYRAQTVRPCQVGPAQWQDPFEETVS